FFFFFFFFFQAEDGIRDFHVTGVQTCALPICLPVSVCGTGTSLLARGFSRQCGIRDFGTMNFPRRHGSASVACGFAYTPASPLGRALPAARSPTLLRHPFAQTEWRWYRNFNLFPIAYAFRPRLRSRLTLSGRTFLRNP